MQVTAPSLNPVPILVVTDAALRLVRRGLLPPSDAAVGARWLGARVLVFRHGPVVYELPAAPSRSGRARDVAPGAISTRAR